MEPLVRCAWLLPAFMTMSLLLVMLPLLMFSRIGKEKLRQEKRVATSGLSQLPKISVIVYTLGNPLSLQRLLSTLIRQDYKGEFEIIVTCDGESDAVADVVKIIGATFKEIKITFVPDDARNLSRKKLAITLGIKASKHDFVLLTHADAVITSYSWIDTVSRLFVQGADIVVGSAVPEKIPGKGLNKSARKINVGLTELTWLSAALNNNPYRASGYNLAYRKNLFFKYNGFARSLNLHFGDDDIFLREIAANANTKVNLQRGSEVRINWGNSDSIMKEYESRRVFTNRNVGRKWRSIASLTVLTAWIELIALTLQSVFFHNEIFAFAISIAIVLIYWTVVIVLLKKGMRQIDIEPAWWEILLGLLLRPLVTIANRRRMQADIETNYTWLKKR